VSGLAPTHTPSQRDRARLPHDRGEVDQQLGRLVEDPSVPASAVRMIRFGRIAARRMAASWTDNGGWDPPPRTTR
jgi:hypothetical protein